MFSFICDLSSDILDVIGDATCIKKYTISNTKYNYNFSLLFTILGLTLCFTVLL